MTKVSMCISIVRGLFGHCSPETERDIDTDASDAEVFNLCCHLLTCEMSACPWYSMSLYHPYIIMKKNKHLWEASKTLAAAWARLEATQSAWKEEMLGGN